MQDDVERVAQLLMDMDGDGRGYAEMARAAMAATLELAAEALRKQPSLVPISPDHYRQNTPAMLADLLQQRANDVKEASNG
jgi:hypothetical protein